MSYSIYIETSVVSYLVSRPSRNILTAARQQLTHEFWVKRLPDYEVFVSDYVLQEVSDGNPTMARLRVSALRGFEVLSGTPEVIRLADHYLKAGALPSIAQLDALHLATCTFHGIDFLVTWNCRHIANATVQKRIQKLNISSGYSVPIICTPEELIEGQL